MLLEGVRDVLQEDQAEDGVLVLGGVHRTPQGVGRCSQLGLVGPREPVGGDERRLHGAPEATGTSDQGTDSMPNRR